MEAQESPKKAQNRKVSRLKKEYVIEAIENIKKRDELAIKEQTEFVIEEFLRNSDSDSKTITQVKQIVLSSEAAPIFIKSAISLVLKRPDGSRKKLGKLLRTTLIKKIITMQQYNAGMKDILDYLTDLSLEIPLNWDNLAEIIVPILKDFISWSFLKDTLQPIISSKHAGELVSSVLHCASKKLGTEKVGEIWRESKLSWTDFLEPDDNVEHFMESHELEFTAEHVNVTDDFKEITPEDLQESLKQLLTMMSNKQIRKWLKGYIPGQIDPLVFRALVAVIYDSVITRDRAEYVLNVPKIQERMPILKEYIDANKRLQLHAIFALQYLMNKFGHPKGLLAQILEIAYNDDLLSEDSFKRWERYYDPAEEEGRSEAISSVYFFLDSLKG